MDKNKHNSIDEVAYRKKDTYSSDEKQIIMDRLDEERRIHQEATKGLDGRKAVYSQGDKNKILNQLNAERLSTQKREEIKAQRTENKEVYKFGSKQLYKFLHMEREYYIEILDCEKLSRRPSIITLYYRTFDELKKKDVLIKTEVYSDKFFISYDAIRVYFKGYSLEDRRKK
jgi:hypothetical protein